MTVPPQLSPKDGSVSAETRSWRSGRILCMDEIGIGEFLRMVERESGREWRCEGRREVIRE